MSVPTITGAKAGQTTTSEAAIKPFSGVTLGDTNANSTDAVSITLAGNNSAAPYGGTLSGTGLTQTGVNSYTLAADTPASVTAALKGLVFTPTEIAPNTKSTTTFTLTDSSSAGTSVSNSTTSVVDSHVVPVPTITGAKAGQTTTSEAAIKPFSGVTLGDTNANSTDAVSITLAGNNSAAPYGGTLSGTGLTQTGVNSYTLAAGTPASVTAALKGLVFTPTEIAPNTKSTTTFTLTDSSSAGTSVSNSTTSVVDSHVVPVPTITGAKAGQTTTSEAAIKPFSGVTLGDTNANSTDAVSITLAGNNSAAPYGGTLSGTGLTQTGVNSYTLAAGTPASVTAALKGLVFTPTGITPNTKSTTTFTLTDSSSAGTSVSNSTTSVVDSHVVPVPTITGAKAGQATTSEAAIKPFSGVTLGDTNANSTDAVSITLAGNNSAAPYGGTLSGTGLTQTGVNSYTLAAGTPASVTAALKGLVFTPTEIAPNTKSTTTFTLTDSSSAGTSVSNSTTSVVDSHVVPVPTITGAKAGQTTTSEAAIKPFSGVTLGDTNANSTDAVSITLAGNNSAAPYGGTLSGTGLTQTGVNSYTLAAGTPASVTAALKGLVFTPTEIAPNTKSTTTFTLTDSSSAGTSVRNSTTSVVDSHVVPAVKQANVESTDLSSSITPEADPVASLTATVGSAFRYVDNVIGQSQDVRSAGVVGAYQESYVHSPTTYVHGHQHQPSLNELVSAINHKSLQTMADGRDFNSAELSKSNPRITFVKSHSDS